MTPEQPLHPKIRLVWTFNSLVVAIVVSVAAFAVAYGSGIPMVAPIALAAAALALAVVVPSRSYAHWRYAIRDNDVSIAKGWLFRSLALMPFDRIQFVETKQGPLDRAFGLTQLVIKTAGGSVGIPGLTDDEANRLRERLSAVVGTLSV